MNHTEALRLTSPGLKPCRATLIADAGRSAVSEDYFRSAHHLRAEGATHTLLIEDGEGNAQRVPLIVRSIEGTPYQDAISPYGFPGGRLDGLSGVSKDAVDWTGIGLVSLFVRDRVSGPRCFAGGTERNEVFLIDSRRPIEFQAEARRQMRRNNRLGYVSSCGPVREVSHEDREGFKEVYRQTMVRDEAHARYFFSDAYFEDLFASSVAWLVTTRAPDGRIASSGVAVASDGVLHYYLGGTADAHLSRSPAKNTIFEAMVELSIRLGLPLHLGGGVRPGDGLEQFKRSFSNTSSRLHTHEVICEPSVYARLSAGHGNTGFFPAYRAPRS
ncbi:GNAT family N-acetyltransferase [Corallococcus sp. AB011P]|uniref:GNAT family N-acetyltransferase n=1 Tax=unclassified Corallococcus TaxID=2685029 RepID=UPI000EA09F83|nr:MULTISPECIES: GNAT family N-acetyltransferase [unclassified Corallococcus]RKG58074.1 GNAT family N-acetyltransferase [Corallococcus sp. AB011P]RKH78776.1 GNAT family N-acetyltransferase [Corallococcus sp. AB045]